MGKVLITVCLIFGTIFGAGFSSGNEIVVFFSRFGKLSYLYIFLSSLMIFLVVYFFLRKGKSLTSRIEQSKVLNVMVLGISVVFAASMYAGIDGLLMYLPNSLHLFFTFIMFLFCLIVTMRGLGGLEKANIILVPVLSVLFLIVLVFASKSQSMFAASSKFGFLGILYSPLYVALNTCMSVFVLAKRGEFLSKKQAFLSSLFSAGLVFFFLVFGNFVLLKNPESFVSEMPFLYLVGKKLWCFLLEFFVILVGCFTTLISLCFTLKNSFIKIVKNDILSIFTSVFLPYITGFLGFSEIISFLYPICSVFGVFIILFSVFSFKQADKIIHSKSKHT